MITRLARKRVRLYTGPFASAFAVSPYESIARGGGPADNSEAERRARPLTWSPRSPIEYPAEFERFSAAAREYLRLNLF